MYTTGEQLLLKMDLIFHSTFNSHHGKVQTSSNYKFKKWREICHDIYGDGIVQQIDNESNNVLQGNLILIILIY